MTRRIVQLAGARAEFALADDGTIWLWTGSGWSDASRGQLPDRLTDWPPETVGYTIHMDTAFKRDANTATTHIAPPPQTVAPEPRPLSLREEIDQKKADLVQELGMKPIKRGPGRPKKEKP